jgi:predicted glycosyltransferase
MTRVAIYTDDVASFGNVRQSLGIAAALGRLCPRPAVLLISSSPEAARLPRPEGCDLVLLPGPVRWGQQGYAVLDLVGRPPRKPRSMRAQIILAALTAFAPDLLVVDRHPRGLGRELEAALSALPGSTRRVLGLRDVLDSPEEAARQWSAERGAEALDAWFDEVWVHGDRQVHDVTAALELPHRLRGAMTFTGYLTRRVAPVPRGGPEVLIGLASGGSEGVRVARSFVAAAALHGLRSELVLGANLSRRDRAGLQVAAAAIPNLLIHDRVPDLGGGLLDRAGAVVSMGGYGTVCEVLGSCLPTLIVPRTQLRHEQLIRATALADRGLVSMLHPDALSPEEIAVWAVAALGTPSSGSGRLAGEVALDGLATVSALTRRLLSERRLVEAAV